MKRCAYCGQTGPLTAEHIWPNGILRRYDDDLLTYNPTADNFYIGDPVIKDVCESCNNASLSVLDAYLCRAYEEYFAEMLRPGDEVTFSFDYEKLLRGLLKISFNSARTRKENPTTINAHEQFARYVREGGYKPNIMLRLQLVTSSTMLIPEKEVIGNLEPNHLRVGTIPYDGLLSHRFLIRLVALKSYWFFLILTYRQEPQHKWRDFMVGFSRWMPPHGVNLIASSHEIHISSKQTTFMHPAFFGTMGPALADRYGRIAK